MRKVYQFRSFLFALIGIAGMLGQFAIAMEHRLLGLIYGDNLVFFGLVICVACAVGGLQLNGVYAHKTDVELKKELKNE